MEYAFGCFTATVAELQVFVNIKYYLLDEKLPIFTATSWSIRMLTGWYWIYCVLVVVAYRASLTAILANPAPRYTFSHSIFIILVFDFGGIRNKIEDTIFVNFLSFLIIKKFTL